MQNYQLLLLLQKIFYLPTVDVKFGSQILRLWHYGIKTQNAQWTDVFIFSFMILKRKISELF